MHERFPHTSRYQAIKHVSILLWAGEYLDIRTAVGSGANSTYPALTVLPQWVTPQFLQFLLKFETVDFFSISSSPFQLNELKEPCSDLTNDATPIPTTGYTTPAAPPKAWATEQVNSSRITWWTAHILLPVVPHKAVAEVSKIGNL